MHQRKLIPTDKVTRDQTGFIDTAIDRLTDTDIAMLSGSGADADEVLRGLREGSWAYLNPKPEQPLYQYKTGQIPNPRINRHQEPARGLLVRLKPLWITATPQRTEPSTHRIRPAAEFDPETYQPEPPVAGKPVPYWEARYRDELWFPGDEEIAVRLQPSAADEQETLLNYRGHAPRVQQDAEARMALSFFPGQGTDTAISKGPTHWRANASSPSTATGSSWMPPLASRRTSASNSSTLSSNPAPTPRSSSFPRWALRPWSTRISARRAWCWRCTIPSTTRPRPK